MIGVYGPTAVEGRFNIIGTNDQQEFIIQGSLSLEEMKELRKELDDAIKAQRRS